ncbi:MAG: response regulator [Alphaproteobacteria bacterium]|nr:MAG: response regulator [Alphaproteobacteria bacterium]
MARILIAEDDASVRSLVARALAMDAHQTVEVGDGEEGLELISGGARFDLLLSDIRMPAMDGITLARWAAKVRPDMVILLMTGYAEQRERAADLNRIIAGVVRKPFTLAQIRDRVAAALAGH